MERRYLVAALAIVATFAVFSRGFHALQRLSYENSEDYRQVAAARHWANSAAQTVAHVRSHFRHGYSPEEAQLVAEMNLPAMESSIAEQMSRQDQAISRCARERALRQAEHARQQAMRMEHEYARAYPHVYAFATPDPAAFSISLPDDFQQRIAERVAESQTQIAAAQAKLAEMEIPTVDVDTQVSTTVLPKVKCKVKVSHQAMREAMHNFQYGFTSK